MSRLDSPLDALPLSAVSRVFRSASSSPMLWAQHVSRQIQHAACMVSDNKAEAGLSHLGRALSLPKLALTFHLFNFLRNPQFRQDANLTTSSSTLAWKRMAWVVKTNGGEGVAWEKTPQGSPQDVPKAKPYPNHKQGDYASSSLVSQVVLDRARQMLMEGLISFGAIAPPASGSSDASSSCIATSYQMSEVVQVVDLVEELGKRGISEAQAEHILDQGLTIGLSVMIGCRFDQGAEFSVVLALLGSSPANPLMAASIHVPSESSYHFHSGRFFLPQLNHWHRFAHACEIPKGARSAVVLLSGRDRSFWAGHYGAKFTSAELTFLSGSKEQYVGSDGVESWRGTRAGVAEVA